MRMVKTSIEGVCIIEPILHTDARGFLMESFRKSWFPEYEFVQENHSQSTKGTVRGLHYQLRRSQGKLIRVVSGEIFDVAVDLRRSSATFSRYVSQILSDENKKMFWIPPGFAHGFLVLSDQAEVIYQCTEYYSPSDEHTLLWNDTQIGIEWPSTTKSLVISDKDRNAATLTECVTFD